MLKAFTHVALLLVAAALPVGATAADPPLPSEEQIEAKLKEARKRLEAAQAKERALEKQLAEAQQTPRGQIRAEVEGVLCWRDEGGGYYIRVRLKEEPATETRVWLVYGEDKVTGQTLDGLKGKDVVAKGWLQQRADGGWWVPAGGMYLTDFEVGGVKAK
jgi:hypothetical protein